MPAGATHAPTEGIPLDEIGQWFDRATETPLGAVLVFALIYLSRLAIDEWQRSRVKPKPKSRKEKRNG